MVRGGAAASSFFAHQPAEEQLDAQEECEGDDQKVDHLAQEFTPVDRLVDHDGLRLRIDVRSEHRLQLFVPLIAGHHQRQQRHDDVVDQRLDDGAEGGPNNHADGQVDDISLEGEGLELVEHRTGLLQRFEGAGIANRGHGTALVRVSCVPGQGSIGRLLGPAGSETVRPMIPAGGGKQGPRHPRETRLGALDWVGGGPKFDVSGAAGSP